MFLKCCIFVVLTFIDKCDQIAHLMSKSSLTTRKLQQAPYAATCCRIPVIYSTLFKYKGVFIYSLFSNISIISISIISIRLALVSDSGAAEIHQWQLQQNKTEPEHELNMACLN